MTLTLVPKPYDSKDDFFEENSKIEYQEVPLDNGRSVHIVSLTAEDMLAWSEVNESNPQKKREANLRLMTKSVVKVEKDADGKIVSHVLVFNDGDIDKLLKMKAASSIKISTAILEFNNLTSKKETAVKND